MARLPTPDPGPSDGVVLLRPWHDRDVPQLVEACKDPEIPKWTAAPDPYTVEDAEAWVEGGPLPIEPPGDRVSFCLADAEQPELLLGSMSLLRIERGRVAEIGYWTAPWARGRGVTARTVRLLAGWAFEEFDLRRIELVAAVENAPSNRVAELAGFTLEGTLRQYREAKGVWRDHHIWSLLRGELG
jgi:RimJ/RimL family protein N-acetyltransferase